MTNWRAILERAAYTCFSKSGGLDFKLKRGDLLALAREVWDVPLLEVPAEAMVQVRLPVDIGNSRVMVLVEEWR